MKKTEKQYLKTLAAAAFLVAVAVLCNTVVHKVHSVTPFENKILTYLRTFIYIGLYSLWGISVSRRVIQPTVRRRLLEVAFLTVFWLVVREIKYRYVVNPDVIRYLWYIYYIPILLIPLIAFLVSLSLGRAEDYKIPKWSFAFDVITFLLIIAVLTNDFHQFVFAFPENAQIWTEFDYKYGALFYVVTAWAALCSISAFVIMIIKSRTPNGKWLVWLPLIPVVAAFVYFSLYVTRNSVVEGVLGDVAAVFSLVFVGFFEGCIKSGLIQSNSNYSELFNAAKKLSAQIRDNSFNVIYTSSANENYPLSAVKTALKSPLVIDGKKRLHTIKINGGYAVWSEDVSELISLRETLEERSDELKERNAFLQLEYEREKEHKTVEEQNRLYDLLQSKTQPQLDRIDRLVQEYKAAENDEEKRRILNRILVIGTFIKRRKDFVLSMEYSTEFPELMLTSALDESFRAIRVTGIRGGYFVNTKRELISGDTLALAYDFFEDVVEDVFDRAGFINLRLTEIDGKLRLSVLTDCDKNITELALKYPDVKIVYDGGAEFIISPEGGNNNA